MNTLFWWVGMLVCLFGSIWFVVASISWLIGYIGYKCGEWHCGTCGSAWKYSSGLTLTLGKFKHSYGNARCRRDPSVSALKHWIEGVLRRRIWTKPRPKPVLMVKPPFEGP